NSVYMAENEPAIRKWHSGLPETARRRGNHPGTIIPHWRRRSSPQKSGPKPKAASPPAPTMATDGAPIATGRPIHHGQEASRRAARAIKEHWRNPDTMTVARRVLEAAYPTDRQMLEAWPPPVQAKPKPAPDRAAQNMETTDGQHVHA